MRFFLVAFALLLGGCGDTRIIDGESYSRACTTVSDCVPVLFGDQCQLCACPNAAISAADRPRFESDRSSAQRSCGVQPRVACGPCQESMLECAGGLCGLK